MRSSLFEGDEVDFLDVPLEVIKEQCLGVVSGVGLSASSRLLLEATLKQIKAATDSKSVSRSKKLSSYFLRVTRRGDLLFRTTSQSTPGKWWYQTIRLLDLKDALELFRREEKIRDRDIVSLAVFGDIQVYCNCLAYKYWGWQYISWKSGFGLRPETRFPSRRNPRLRGAVCKHLYSVLTVLPFHINGIVKELRRTQFVLPGEEEEGEAVPRLKGRSVRK